MKHDIETVEICVRYKIGSNAAQIDTEALGKDLSEQAAGILKKNHVKVKVVYPPAAGGPGWPTIAEFIQAAWDAKDIIGMVLLLARFFKMRLTRMVHHKLVYHDSPHYVVDLQVYADDGSGYEAFGVPNRLNNLKRFADLIASGLANIYPAIVFDQYISLHMTKPNYSFSVKMDNHQNSTLNKWRLKRVISHTRAYPGLSSFLWFNRFNFMRRDDSITSATNGEEIVRKHYFLTFSARVARDFIRRHQEDRASQDKSG